MKISYNLFVYKCFWSYIYYTAKAVLHPGSTVFCYDIEKTPGTGSNRPGAVLRKWELLTANKIRFGLRDVVRAVRV